MDFVSGSGALARHPFRFVYQYRIGCGAVLAFVVQLKQQYGVYGGFDVRVVANHNRIVACPLTMTRVRGSKTART